MRAEFDAVSCKSPMSGPVTVRTVSRLQHDHRGTDRHAIIKVDYVLVDKPDAAARRRRANSMRLVSSMQTEIGILAVTVEIKGPRPERIFSSACHATSIGPIVGHSSHHVRGRGPARLRLFAPDHGGAVEVACLCPADTHSIA